MALEKSNARKYGKSEICFFKSHSYVWPQSFIAANGWKQVIAIETV
jgi:hypothetical protein